MNSFRITESQLGVEQCAMPFTTVLFVFCIALCCIGGCKPPDSTTQGANCQPWAIKASQCVQDLEMCKRLAQPYQHDVDALRQAGIKYNKEHKASFKAVVVIGTEVNALLWELWKATGQPPSLDKANTHIDIMSVVDENIIRYRKHLAKYGHREEECVQREGLLAAAELLNSRYNGLVIRYLYERLDPEKRIWMHDNIHILDGVPKEVAVAVSSMHGQKAALFFGPRGYGDANMQKAWQAWLAGNLDSLVWDENKKMFLTKSGGYVDTPPVVTATE